MGTDVLDTKDDQYEGLDLQKYQEQTILLSSLSGDFAQLNGRSFALTFVSRLNETFTTVPIKFSDTEYVDLQNDIKLALLKLPNGVIDGVKVTVDYIVDAELYNLVSDNLFPAVSFVVDETTAESALNGAPKLTLQSGSRNTRLAVGCKLSGAMVPREETAIAAVVSLGGTGNLEFTDTYNTDQRTSMVTKDVTCAQGQASFMSAADTTLLPGTWYWSCPDKWWLWYWW